MDRSDDFNDSKKPSHISYKQYQKKISQKPNEGLMIFVSAFFIMLLLFLAVAKQISPDVDVTIGDGNAVTAEDKSSVDDRLKNIQNEDGELALNKEDEIFTPELDERIVIPADIKIQKEQVKEDAKQKEAEKVKELEKEKAKTKEAETQKTETSNIKTEPILAPVDTKVISSKVVVGYYATEAQAQVAKGIISEAGLGITPFIKNIGGAYTIQVGSYSSREKAQNLANELLRNNFPARVITE